MNHLQLFDKLEAEGKYTIITASTGRGKTWATALLYLKTLAESQALAPDTPPKEKEANNAKQGQTTNSQRGGRVLKALPNHRLAMVQ